MKKKINVCIRETKHGEFKGSKDIVILDHWDDIYDSRLECFGNVGESGSGYCHSSGDFTFFRDSTKNIGEEQAKDIMKAFRAIYECDYEIVVKSRLTTKLAV